MFSAGAPSASPTASPSIAPRPRSRSASGAGAGADGGADALMAGPFLVRVGVYPSPVRGRLWRPGRRGHPVDGAI